jgi:hypothetical protein
MFRSFATRKSATAVTALALAALILSTALSDETFGATISRAANPTRIASVDDAVRLGVVDRELVDLLRAGTEAVGVVSFDGDAPQPELSARDEALVEADYEHVSSIVMRFPDESALLRAARRAGVERISASRTGEAHTEQSLGIVRQPEVYQAGHRGRGTYVAVLDTGVDAARYPAYFPAGSLAASYDASGANGRALSFGHGTHVASTVLRVAPATRIISVDVFDWNGTALPQWNSNAIIRGVNYLIGLKKQYLADNTKCCNIVAMNLSLGTSNTYHNEFCTDGLGFRAAYDVGIIPVVSSGNDASRSGSFRKGVSYPACSNYALSVGASTDGAFAQTNRCEASAAADRLATFSQTGPTLQILAPGTCIVAATGANQGTSMAAPHVAGAVAVLAGARPNATPASIWTALTSTGKAITDTRPATAVTRNRLNVSAALNKLIGTTTSPVTDGAPVVKAPTAAITAGASIGQNGLVHTTFSWSATDASGIAAYAVKLSTNGGAWTNISLASATSTSIALLLTAGSKYRLTVAARDGAGNWSGWSNGAAFTVGRYGENHSAVTYSGRWEARSWTSALGGSLNVSGTAGAYGCFRFNARNVAWLGTMDTNRGVATVWLDGTKIATLDLYSATVRARTVLLSRTVDPSVTHNLCVQVVGTVGRPTIDIDGFALLY